MKTRVVSVKSLVLLYHFRYTSILFSILLFSDHVFYRFCMLFSVFQNIVFTGFRQPFRYSYTVFFTCLNPILMVRSNNVYPAYYGKHIERLKIIMKKQKLSSLLPIAVFLIFYLGLGIWSEYIMKIPMGFYNIPIVVAFMLAILTACFQNRSLSFDRKLELMGQGIGDKNIITMLLIFLTAGTFVGVVGRSSAESVAYLMLSLIPARFSVAVLFVVACFVSTSMGTSVGTITLIVPIAAAVSETSGFSLALCVASVIGGAMFGDNLSFISDTTIAACNGQGCAMKDKFRENFGIALPAAHRFPGTYPGRFLPSGSGSCHHKTIQPDSADPLSSGISRRHCRYSGICRSVSRNRIRCHHYAGLRPDYSLGNAYQHGFRHFRHV